MAAVLYGYDASFKRMKQDAGIGSDALPVKMENGRPSPGGKDAECVYESEVTKDKKYIRHDIILNDISSRKC